MQRLIACLALCLIILPASAEVPLSGIFTATIDCAALQSISRQTNPGDVTLEPGRNYELVAANKTPASHVLVIVPGASPDRRWVETGCGATDAGVALPQDDPAPRQYVLAVNWQPAFCESAPDKRECRSQRPGSFEATNFTLHGLWPQPRSNEYCGVSQRDIGASRDGRWHDLPRLDLTLAQRRDLDKVMPGSQSALDRHEWIKHGTCYGTDQGDYYADALDLMLALNASPVVDLFAGNIGRHIARDEVRSAFDASFGPGAGERVSMSCIEDGHRVLITELQINLAGEITGPDDFPSLLLAAPPTNSDCTSGQVDAVGVTSR